MHHVHEDEQLLIVTEGGILIRMNIAEIRRIGRATQGVRLIRLDEGDRVVSVAVAGADNDDDDDDADGAEFDESQIGEDPAGGAVEPATDEASENDGAEGLEDDFEDGTEDPGAES